MYRATRTLVGGFLLAAAANVPFTAAGLASSSWPMQNHDAQATGFSTGEQLIGRRSMARLQRVWTHRGIFLQAVATGSRVYAFGSTAPNPLSVLVLDARSGRLVRTFTPGRLGLNGSGYTLQSLAFGQGKLIVGSVGQVLAVDPATGKRFWSVPGGATSLVINGSILYTTKLCADCGPLASSAINLQSGHVLWKHAGGESRPVLIGGHLYTLWGPYFPGETRVYDPINGRLLAKLPLEGQWLGDTDKSFRVAPGDQASIARIGPAGKPIWKLSLGKNVGGSRAVYAYGKLYVPSNRFHRGILAVNARNGHVQWGANVGATSEMLAANHLLFVLRQQSRQLDILDAGSGKVLRRLTVPSGAFPSTEMMLADGTLYVPSGDSITAFRV